MNPGSFTVSWSWSLNPMTLKVPIRCTWHKKKTILQVVNLQTDYSVHWNLAHNLSLYYDHFILRLVSMISGSFCVLMYYVKVPCSKPSRWQSVGFSASLAVPDTSPAHPASLWPTAGEAPLYQVNKGRALWDRFGYWNALAYCSNFKKMFKLVLKLGCEPIFLVVLGQLVTNKC